MKRTHIFVVLNFLTILFVKCSYCRQAIVDDYYTAGVVEFRPLVMGATSDEILADHLEAYVGIIHSKEANATDIIVFPEGTLNTILNPTAVPTSHVNLCADPLHSAEYEPFLKTISCAARDTAKYIVINIKEKAVCSASDERQCASNGYDLFNTNVVFDREGRVISTYRKWHTYQEPNINRTEAPEYGIFRTDFGVTFGHFICFDMLFYTPAQELVVKYGIRDIIFTSMFYSELPFLTATQLQQSWAWANNVNLLAAGASYPQSGITGSGIYAGATGSLVRRMVGTEGVRELLVARVPKYRKEKRQINRNVSLSLKHKMHQTGVTLLKDPLIANFTSELLDAPTGRAQNYERQLCHEKHCCTFIITTHPMDQGIANKFYRYRIGAYNGKRSYEDKTESSYVRICALYACTNESASSCGDIFGAEDITTTIFDVITIATNVDVLEHLLIMPNTLDTELYSLNSESIEWVTKRHTKSTEAVIQLKMPHTALLTFGIYANCYDSSAAVRTTFLWVSLLVGYFGTMLNRLGR